MWKIFALLALSVNICVSSPVVRTQREFSTYRLPNTTVPTHYNLYLDTDVHLGVFEYTGNVKISIRVLEDIKQIVLHSVRNEIQRIQLFTNQLPVPVQGFEFDVDKEFLIVNTNVWLHAGESYVLDIDFTNSLERNDQAGFYLSSYVNDAGETKFLGVTQFESCDARSSFPCYDEPGLKTTYDVKIACGLEYTAKSNAPASGIQILSNGKKLTTFQRSPRMQTYLVAFLVSDFANEREVSKEPHQVAVSTLARPTARHALTYSVDASVKFLREMEKYFDQSYAMTKIDNVAVANNDFAAGAMENWGLVTYRESTILFDPEIHGESVQLSVVGIVGHEYTHQFFGNLLAPKWWSYLWLNEGFARFYQYYVSEFSHPELNMRERFAGVRTTALNTDASATVRPMTHYVETTAEISRLFDNIAYAKSASVLRMFNYALTEKTFQKGIRYYVQQNKDNGVVEEQDLFNSLQQAAAEDVRLPLSLTMNEVFSSWSNQPGAPAVTVTRVGTTNEYLFSQERFFNTPQDNPSTQSWWIPISFTSSSNAEYETRVAFWMPPGVSEVSYRIDGDQVLINPQATGYYRVNYDPEMWASIIRDLHENPNTIHKLSRSQLIDDSMQLAHAGKLDYDTAFKVMDYLREEVEYVPWETAAYNLDYLHRMLRSDKKASESLENYVADLAKKLLSTYGLEPVKGESANAEEARLFGLKWACKKDERCRAKANEKINRMRKRSTLEINSKSEQLLMCHQLRYINQLDIVTMVDSLRMTRDDRSRGYLIDALSCVEDKSSINYVLNSLKLKDFKANEKLQVIQNIFQNSVDGFDIIMELLNSSTNVVEDLNINRRAFHDILENLAKFATDTESAAQVMAIVEREAPVISADVRTKLSENRSWIERNSAAVIEALNKYL
ncbi:protease m1 zinc metalloprotease [Culex quinquefasciatus]|uniref:Aminopeptidase n=1 Tax=Culex quinquefasciatus TaxID=7176 RepID=B0W1Y4_CULQU|nr:protease m1 zinc metalloprotease [Culex quinquefasciatus]|eukprot:XP_001842718.1 protease m1 zinc metalloprotease [Culex quinquefasciatus]